MIFLVEVTGNASGLYGGGLSVVPAVGYAATVNLGVPSQGHSSPDISGNSATHAGGGVYASGADATITINSGRIIGNTVSALVDNPQRAQHALLEHYRLHSYLEI